MEDPKDEIISPEAADVLTMLEREPNWRQVSLRDALLTTQGSNWSASLRIANAVGRYQPKRAVHIFSESKESALKAFQASLSTWMVVCGSPEFHLASGQVTPLCGWWTGQDSAQENAEFEVILVGTMAHKGHFVVSGPDGAKVQALVERVLAAIETERPRTRVYSGGWTDAPEMEEEIAKIAWGDIVLPATLETDIQDSVTQFFEQREVFRQLRFPWRRGILLVGPPGTGKTMICKATAAAHTDYPFLYIRDLGRRASGSEEVEQIFSYARKAAPCILAFEDIENLLEGSKRTVFLNEVNGFQNNDGLLIIASSNHPEKIDEALLKRPSRFDRVYHIGLPAPAERRTYALHLIDRAPNCDPALDRGALAAKVAARTEGFTPAFIKEAFTSAMLQSAQEGRAVLDARFADAVLAQVETLRAFLNQTNDIKSLNEIIGTSGDSAIGFRRRRSSGYEDDEDN